MFLLRSSYVPLLEAVACQCRLPFPSYLREVAEDGSVVGGVEIELPVSGAPNEFRTHFFWSSGHAELCLLYEQAAFEAITFLQGLYGFVIADYNYEVMVGYRTLARSAALLAAAVARLAHASGSAVVVGSGDGFHPNVDPSIQARNRRIRRKTIDLRRHKFRGAIPLYYLSASLLGSLYHVDVCCVLFFAMYIEHVVTGPLPTDWTGFPAEFAESLKANYAGRSYHGSPEYRCPHCKAVFWFQESIQSASSWKENRIVYNLCCKGGKVFIDPFKEPPPLLSRLLNFDGDRASKLFLRKIRQYNCLFAFTSMGANVDRSLKSKKGPDYFKISGQTHHRLGSLLPAKDDSVPPKYDSPKYAELYIYDTSNEVDNRIRALHPDDSSDSGLDKDVVAALIDMLNEHNPLVQQFRQARERLKGKEVEKVSIRLIAPKKGDGPQFSLPSTNELAALVVGDFTPESSCRDIVIQDTADRLQQVSFLHPAFMSLQYPLLFPYAERGFQLDIPYRDAGDRTRVTMTMQDYYCYLCHYRPDQPNPYLCYALLSSQAVVDARACIDENRLWYILKHQDDFRSESLEGITDSVDAGNSSGAAVGKKTILPSSHTGGKRYFMEHFQDGLAICRVYGAPTLFETFTCNPKWPEIAEALLLEPGQKPHDSADIIVRVYNMKLEEHLADVKAGLVYGPIHAVLHTVEFQKRGLPHAHILIWLKGDKREVSAETIDTIDDFICAEIPDPILDPLGYVLVSEFMMHGPCGELNDKCVCMKENTCSKHFPKEFREETIIDEHGFALYRRRRDGRTVYKNGHYLDNRWVVPYNMAMLKKYQAHLNVEWCNKTQVMKYLFKYVTKGPDFSNVYLQRAKANCSAADGSDPPPVDEVNEYLLARYICEQDAFWRIYGYTLHGKTPAVERLVVHLQNKNWISFSASTNLFRLAASDFLKKTTLTEWFVANRNYEEGRCLTYCDYPTKFTWDGESRSWHPRGGGKKIGRVYYVGPNAGELYYLRMLLMIVKGARSFVDVRTFQGTVYGSFKEACVARGLLGDDLEWYRAFDEAVVWGFGHRLRHLFVTMLIHCSVKNEKDFFSKYWVHLADDIQYRIRIALRKMDYMVPEAELKDLLLDELSSLFVKYGSSIANFNLPGKTSLHPINYDNRLIREEMSYDAKKLSAVAATLLLKLNADQRVAYKTIVDTVLAEKPGFYFVSGFGGAGKTFLWNAIIAYLRGQGKIVLTVASSGVAALLLAGGRTAHSRFKIPLQVDSNSFCDIKRGTNLADLLKETCLIIWDEALMTSRKCFEALDRTLRDVLSGDDPLLADVPFGGKVVVLGGDLRQILPVIEGGSRPQIIDAAITQSPLWKSVVPLVLSINMRLSVPDAASSLKESIQVFSKWVLDLGDGKLPTTRREGESESTWIQIPEDLLIRTDDNKIAAIVSSTYVDFLANYHRMEYLRERAILAPTNDFALEVNDFVLGLVPQPPREYLSCDSIANGSDAVNEVDLFYPPEVLNAIALINFPQHKLVLKPGVPIMLLRNLSQANGLCNGTRLVVKELGDRVIQAVIMTGSHIGDVVYIPRIELISNKTKWPFLLKRRQFPVRVCYAMTINKSQGQTLSFVGIYLKQPVFCHGQLYVAVSRVTSRSALKLLILNADGSCGSETRNIVFPEIYASAGSL
ncbi:hypothetical protein ACQ4PT_059380 [Festuca glaucescens]